MRQTSTYYYSAANSVFTHFRELQGQAIWFHPPHVLAHDATVMMAKVWQAAPTTTYLLGLVPYLPNTTWFKKWVLRSNSVYKIKRLLPAGHQFLLRTGTQRFKRIPTASYAQLHEAPLMASPLKHDMVVIEA